MEKWIFDFTCSSFSGIFGTIFGHPLDTIKVILCNISAESKVFQKKNSQWLKSYLKF